MSQAKDSEGPNISALRINKIGLGGGDVLRPEFRGEPDGDRVPVIY